MEGFHEGSDRPPYCRDPMKGMIMISNIRSQVLSNTLSVALH